MTLVAWLIAVMSGAVLGLVAALIRRPHGFAASLLLGGLGGGVGGWLGAIFGLTPGDLVPFAASSAAAAALVVALSWLVRRG